MLSVCIICGTKTARPIGKYSRVARESNCILFPERFP